ncbi:MAG: HU family DNA-binding protein [Mycobacteriales bacterium]
MNKSELIDSIADRIGVDKRTANNAVDAVLETVTRAVAKGERVALTGFGVFEKIERPARMGRNPQTGERVRVKKTAVPKFRPGAQFKGVVSGAVKLAKETTSAARGGVSRAVAPAAPAKKAATKAAAPAKKTATKATATKATAKSTPAKKTAAKRTTK